MSPDSSSEPALSSRFGEATHPLSLIQEHVSSFGGTCFTTSAQDGVWHMELTMAEAIQAILSHNGPAYKTMPVTHADFAEKGLWQDVYHIPTRNGLAYVKFTYDKNNYRIVTSFKKLLPDPE